MTARLWPIVKAMYSSILDTSISPYGEKPINMILFVIKFLYNSKNCLPNQRTMTIWIKYIKQIYTAFIWVSGLKLCSLGDCNCAILLRAVLLSKVAQLQSPRTIALTIASPGSIYLYTINQGRIQDLQKEGTECQNWLIQPHNRLNLYDLAVKGGGADWPIPGSAPAIN